MERPGHRPEIRKAHAQPHAMRFEVDKACPDFLLLVTVGPTDETDCTVLAGGVGKPAKPKCVGRRWRAMKILDDELWQRYRTAVAQRRQQARSPVVLA